ncbi:Unknown protein sequence [Pseudomonas syringae pv. maculicola]|nr:Unknown protein sequence [Pseudomonas syringae pv. maculicola]
MERKQSRARPEFLNQAKHDRVASNHAAELSELGAEQQNATEELLT